MKRNKIISVRVNEELYNKVQKIINNNTKITHIYYKNIYQYTNKDGKTRYEKFTIADILENALKEFIKSNTFPL